MIILTFRHFDNFKHKNRALADSAKPILTTRF